jgi:hypothetical protein
MSGQNKEISSKRSGEQKYTGEWKINAIPEQPE